MDPVRHPPYVAVVGAGTASGDVAGLAEQVGREVARRGAVLVTGGMTGVMEAACRGARAAGGATVGLLPGSGRADANPHVTVALPTGLGEARNVLVVRVSDALVAVGGEYGTLSEIAFALKTGVPVVGLSTWDIDGVVAAGDPAEAVEVALRLATRAVSGGPATPPPPAVP